MPLITLLIEHGANVNARTATGATPLFLACQRGNKKAVELLLKHHADPDLAETKTGNTPLHAATFRSKKGIIRLLLEAKANFNAINNKKLTPLQLAQSRAWYLLFNEYYNSHYANAKNIKNQLKLVTYPSLRNQAGRYKHAFKLFGKTFLDKPLKVFGHRFNLPREEKTTAAKQLNEVMYHGADSATLNVHHDALHNGELGSIYRVLKPGRV